MPESYFESKPESSTWSGLSKPPQGSTHWSTRTLADNLGVSHMTVHRVWRDNRLQPHRSESFKFSTDPLLAEKVVLSESLHTSRFRKHVPGASTGLARFIAIPAAPVGQVVDSKAI